jgi:DNA-binding winged helix-turn-helix (wHTH) protein
MRFGEFVFDGAARQLTRNAEPIHLAPKAFELLQLLIEERPRAVRKKELMDRLWPDVVVEEANLKNLVAEVRAVLGAQTIRTVQRYGYAFAALDSEEAKSVARLIQGDRIHRLKPGENLIGRDDDCSVILDFTGVSRHHATIRIAEGRYVLEDLGSRNGTWRNDERVKGSVDLRDGDRIRLGGVPLTFRSTLRAESTATLG